MGGDLETLYQELESSGVTVDDSVTIGVLTVFGQNAFPFLVGKYSSTIHPLAAASRFGQGKLVAFAHSVFVNPVNPSQRRFLTNSVLWTESSTPRGATKIRVKVYPKYSDIDNWVKENGSSFDIEYLNDYTDIDEKLKNTDVLLLTTLSYLSGKNIIEAIKSFVQNGGGLIVGATAWALGQDYKQNEYNGNLIFRDAGICWTQLYSTKPIEPGTTAFSTNVANLTCTHACTVWNELIGVLTKDDVTTESRLDQLTSILDIAMSNIPKSDDLYVRVKKELGSLKDVIPTAEVGISKINEKRALKYKLKWFYEMESLGGNDTSSCHPAAQYFPGLLPSKAEKIQNHSIKINVLINAWYSTGLYAPPGEDIIVKFTEPTTIPMSVQIGCHINDISRRDNWYRCPVLTVQKSIDIGKIELSMRSAFGGLIYILLDKKQTTTMEVEVSISGATLAPYFILGKTSVEDWKTSIRSRCAPWGELQTNKMILTLPSSKLATLDDPKALMEFWDIVMDAFADLAGIPLERPYPERMVADIQTSAGWMLSGYPIKMHIGEAVDTALSLECLNTRKAWGHYHEIGHNHQITEWTYSNGTEITNNIFVLYVMEKVCHLPFAVSRPENLTQDEINSTVENILASGPDYNTWSDNPFWGLLFYVQLQMKYGWEAYKKYFRSYQTLSDVEKPYTNQEKLDRLLIQFSNVVGENLTPLFREWGIPLTEDATNSVAHLPPTQLTLKSLVV